MRLPKMITVAAFATCLFTSCKKDKDPIIVIPPSSGSSVEFNGLAGTEAGSAASNSVYIDLSTNTMTTSLRSGWDLGFYGGSDFRVMLNNFTSAGAKVLAQNDLNIVGEADTIGLTLAVSQATPAPTDFAYFDNIDGSVTGTVIPEVSSTDANNKVIIINRGTGGSIAARPWMKIRVLRNSSGGYTLQYAAIKATTFQTLQIPKDASYHFKLVSFDNGILTNGQPEKNKWDFVWSYSLFQTNFGSMVPYNFSDIIALNNLSNLQAKEKVYANAATSGAPYTTFKKKQLKHRQLLE